MFFGDTVVQSYNEIFDENSQPMWVYDSQTFRFLAVNNAAIGAYGYDRDFFLSLRLTDISSSAKLPEAVVQPIHLWSGEISGLINSDHHLHIANDGRRMFVKTSTQNITFEGKDACLDIIFDVTDSVLRTRAAQVAQSRSEYSRKLLSNALDHLDDGFLALNADFSITYLNQRGAKILGLESPARMIGEALLEQVPSVLRGKITAVLNRAQNNSKLEVFEFRGTTHDTWLEGRVYPSSYGLTVFLTDISERKLFEKLLLRSEREFRLLADNMPALLYRSTPDGSHQPTYINRYINRLGYSAEDWISHQDSWLNAIHEDDRATVYRRLSEAYQSGSSCSVQYRIRDSDGNYRYFRDTSLKVEADSSSPGYIQGIALDITDLVQIQEELTTHQERLRQSEQRYRLAAANGQVWDWDPKTQRLEISGDFWRQLGYEPIEPSHSLEKFQELLHPEDKQLWRAVLSDHLNFGHPYSLEFRIRDGSGSWRWLETSGQAMWDADGAVSYMAGTAVDITARKRAEGELVASEARLSELARRLLDQERIMTRRIAQSLHDRLGQTLAVARLSIDSFPRAAAGATEAAIQEGLDRLSKLVNQAVQDVRHALADLRPPVLEEQGLSAALDNEVRSLSATISSPDILLETDHELTSFRWPIEVEYTAFMIAREAIANSLRHASASLVRVTFEGTQRNFRLCIIDDGIGIPEELVQGRSGHLGIVGMRERAQSVGALISINNEPGGGTRVSLNWKVNT